MKIILNNKSPINLKVMLEPVGDSFDITSLGMGELHFSQDDLEIDVNDESCISFWTDGDVKVVLSSGELTFPNIA